GGLLRSSRGSSGAQGSIYDLMDSSSKFLSLNSLVPQSHRMGTRLAAAASGSKCSRGARRAPEGTGSEFSSGKAECFTKHSLRPMRKSYLHSSDSSFDKSMEMLSENVNGRHFTRQLAKLQADQKMKIIKTDVKAAEKVHGESGDVEVHRSCRVRQSRYSTTNQSILFDKLITNTAEAVLQKMGDMKKMCRRRMIDLEDFGVFSDAEEENLNMYARGSKEETSWPKIGPSVLFSGHFEMVITLNEEVRGNQLYPQHLVSLVSELLHAQMGHQQANRGSEQQEGLAGQSSLFHGSNGACLSFFGLCFWCSMFLAG
uniref:Uncharacterized protein n=1 Tax=Gopherus agassizii TaxID=38772 RepID=A0A452HCR7_9SAUR